MRLFSEEVKITSSNSPLNILQVKDFSEVFFGVFEVQINENKYVVEKISEENGNPIVSILVEDDDVKAQYPFLLLKGKQEIYFNSESEPVEIFESKIENEEDEDLEIKEVVEESFDNSEIIEDKKQQILEEIKRVKRNAVKKSLEILEQNKLKKIQDIKNESKKKENALKEYLESARENLVDEFTIISGKIKNELISDNDYKFDEIRESIDLKIQDIADNLNESLKNNFKNSSKLIDRSVKQLVKELYESNINPKVDKELHNIAEEIVDKVSEIDKNLNNKLDKKADVSLLEGVNKEIDAIRDANIELNNSLNKGVQKALSRVGNVDKKILEISGEFEKISEKFDNKISETEQEITQYFDEKLSLVKEETLDITDEARKYFQDLIQESRNGLLSEIRKIKDEKPVEYILESKKGEPIVKDWDSIEKEWNKKIHDKFENYKTDLRKYVAVYASGGGTNATQYQNGGTMNGNLTIVGAISASQYLGITGGSATGDYLPLSGGTVDGNVTITGTISAGEYLGISIPSGEYLPLSGGTVNGNVTIVNSLTADRIYATQLEALSANITVIDIKQYELSGFNVTGNVTINGSVSASQYLGVQSGVVVSTSAPALTSVLWAAPATTQELSGQAPVINVNGGQSSVATGGNFYEIYTKVLFSKATVNAASSGTVRFELRQGHSTTGTLISAVDVNVITGTQEITLNLEIDPTVWGDLFTIQRTGTGPTLFRTTVTPSYPLLVSDPSFGVAARAVGSTFGNSFYYWFYSPKFTLIDSIIYRSFASGQWSQITPRRGAIGPQGGDGPNSVTSVTTSDGTASLSVSSLSASTIVAGTTVANPFAIVDIQSTSRGLLPPRMTSTQRNAISGATVPSGLTVFNSTDNALSVYTTVLSSWDNILTTRSASFTSDTLRNACSQTQGTGSLVFDTAPTIANGNFTYDAASAATHRTSLSLDRYYIQQAINQQSSTIVYDFDNSYMPAILGVSRTIPSGGSAQIANVGGTHWTSKVKGWLRIANPTANDAVTEVGFGDATMPYQSGTGAPTAQNNYTLVYVFCCPNLTNVDIRLGLRSGNVARIIQLFQDNVASPGSSPVFNFFTSNGTYTNTATATGAISGAPTPQVGSYTAGTGTRYAFVFDTYQRAGGTDTSVTLKIYSGNVTGDLSLAGTYVLANWNPTNTASTPYVSVRTINSTAAASSFLHLDTVILKAWNNTSNILPTEILDLLKTP